MLCFGDAMLCTVCNTLSAPRWSRNISNMDWAFSIQSVCNRHDQVKNWQRKELIAARCPPVHCWVCWCAMHARILNPEAPYENGGFPFSTHIMIIMVVVMMIVLAASSCAQIYSEEVRCGATVFGLSIWIRCCCSDDTLHFAVRMAIVNCTLVGNCVINNRISLKMCRLARHAAQNDQNLLIT